MGRLYDEFGALTFRNEAEVSQNFILPLLVNYLGYESREIIPEHNYPVKDIYSGVNFAKNGSKSLQHRPDFVVCLNGDVDDPKFVIDSKGPDEDIDGHLDQLRSYSVSVQRNLLMLTNGKSLKVYDVNNLLFHSSTIEDLQLKINKLLPLLGRESHALKPSIEIIKDFDYKGAIGQFEQATLDTEIRRKRILLSDFREYLQNVCVEFENWHWPTQHFQALDNLQLSKIDPNYLLLFREHKVKNDRFDKRKLLKLPEIETDRQLNIKIFIGETGSGKTCLLKFLAYKAAQTCQDLKETRIPVFISLREIGQNYNLEHLIVDFLNRRGYSCSAFYNLPKTNDFLFFLDAYDEVADHLMPETFHAIEKLSSKFECYLTSRPNKIPLLKPALTFDILPISESQINSIVRQYIDSPFYTFQRQLEINNLKLEAGNVLLLLFLVSLFKESGSLPTTVTQVIRAIVERVKIWQDGKSAARKQLKWKVIEQFLALFAYRLVEANETSLTRTESEILLRKKLSDLEVTKEVQAGLSTYRVLEWLAETGLVIVNEDHLYFWHRLFLNYFCSIGLKIKHADDCTPIGVLAKEERWHVPIIGLSGLLPSITSFLKVLDQNLFLAAICLVENNTCDDSEALKVITALIDDCKSVVPNVRIRAVNLLSKIGKEYVTKFFLDAVDSNYNWDVRMSALRVIGKTKSPQALEVIYQNLECKDSSIWSGVSAPACIARALYYYDREEHLQIVKNWADTGDWLMDEECIRIFTELHSQGRLSQGIVSALQEAFIAQLSANHAYRDKLMAMAKVLALVPDDQFATRLVELTVVHKELHKLDGVCELLKECHSLCIVDLIKKKIFEDFKRDHVAQELVKIITESVCEIPKEVYFELATHENPNVASYAIGALKRFPYKDVASEIDKYLYGDQPQLQSWALQVLVDNGEIVGLIRRKAFPQHFYSPAAHTLLKAIRRFHLVEGMPLMERIFNALSDRKRYLEEIHVALELAGTYFFMGDENKHSQIIALFFNGDKFIQHDDNIHFHLMKSLKYFEPTLSSQMAQCYFRTYFPFTDEDRFKMNVFLEAVDDLGQRGLKPLVKEIVDHLLTELEDDRADVSFHIERPMRTLVGIVEPEDESWILERLDKMKTHEGFAFPQLRRATEALAYAGSHKSIPYVKTIAIQFEKNDLVLNVCQFAYEQICNRERIPCNSNDLFER